MLRRGRIGPHAPKPDVTAQEQQIVTGLSSLRDATAREVMTPRMDLVTLQRPVVFDDVARAVLRSGHSHFPVYENDLDHLVGVLFVKDLFQRDLWGRPAHPAGTSHAAVVQAGASAEDGSGRGTAAPESGGGATGSRGSADLSSLAREPFIVPESHSALELLAEMRKQRRGFAVVVDEYGGVAGVVTINDLVSELVGDIQDEFDRTTTPSIRRVDGNRFLVDGACDVDDVRDVLEIAIPDGEYVTLGGFLLDRFGRIPAEGDELSFQGWVLRVARMGRRRIAKVLVHAPSATIAGQDVSSPSERAGHADGK
jgi:putative hemolysin